MDDPTQAAVPPELEVALLVLLGASLFVGSLIVWRLRSKLPVLPYQNRRQVPWRAWQVMAVFLVMEFPLLAGLVLSLLLEPQAAGPGVSQTAGEVDVRHVIEDLLRADPSPTTWLLCILVAVVVAPIIEEFTYRLILQGWLEAEERLCRRRIPELRRLIPGVIPVLLVSLLFAARHFRLASCPIEADLIKQILVFQAVWSTFVFTFTVMFLRIFSGATAADFGFVGKKFLADVRLGLLACAGIVAPLLFLQIGVTTYILPDYVAADPIPLFFLALVLGTVYYRTHRITPAIVIHMAFNATSLVLAWLEL